MTRFESKKQEVQVESSFEENGKFYVVAKALSKDFECEAGRRALAKDIVRQAITWRHRHPLEKEHKENHIYGRAAEGWVDDKSGFLMVKAEFYDHTQDHKDFINTIKKRDFVKDPLGWSMHYRTYFNEKTGKKYHWDVFELAGTPFPACDKCKTVKIGVEKMVTKNEQENKDEAGKSQEEKELEKAKEVEKALETIKELEEKLNSKTEAYEGLNAKIQKLESQIKQKDSELEDKTRAEKSLEDRMLEMENEMKFLKEKKPILDQILELNPSIDERELKWLRSEDKDYLEERLEKEKDNARKKPQAKDLEESVLEAQKQKEQEDKELEEKEKDITLKHFTSQLEGLEDIKE
jgi:myosin heavy subunit